jgi:hypothetical protein
MIDVPPEAIKQVGLLWRDALEVHAGRLTLDETRNHWRLGKYRGVPKQLASELMQSVAVKEAE